VWELEASRRFADSYRRVEMKWTKRSVSLTATYFQVAGT